MLKRFVLALPLALAFALPALAADPQPQPAPELDTMEQAMLTEWRAEGAATEAARQHVLEAAGKLIGDRRTARAQLTATQKQLADTLQKCGDRCQEAKPAPQAKAAPSPGQKAAE
jgi:hypothetical protein